VISGLAWATLVVVLVVALVIVGDPIDRVNAAWDSFKQGYTNTPGQPLAQGLGSGRYDYYTVALNLFSDHPLNGIGADNFQQDYLAVRKSDETPRYPHSVEMRTLAQTGVVGVLLLIGFIAAALAGAAGAMRRASPLAKAVAAAGTMAFGYWLIHGSFDWFWEFAGLGVPAFAMLGLACGLAPARKRGAAGEERMLLPRIALVVGLVLGVISMALPWLSDVSTQYAAEHWRADPEAAYKRLDRAASLDPLSAEPYLAAGTIALKRSEQARAQAYFREALERQPRSAYATLELGALASSYGNRAAAERLLVRTVRLDPRDELSRKALADVRAGRQVSIEQLNAAILGQVRAVERGG
jgi:Tfp pilus assembly protein PilF